MASRQKKSRPQIREPFPATVSVNGQQFTFWLHTRTLELGDAGPIDYYWMNASQFRHQSAAGPCPNFRSCIDHWWAAVTMSGRTDDYYQWIHYAKARMYPVVCRDKSMQKIYSDAFLGKFGERSDRTDPEGGLRPEVRDVLTTRNSMLVQKEMDRALGWTEFSPAEERAFSRKHDDLTRAGAAARLQHGEAGVTQFLKEVKDYFASARKRGGRATQRKFIRFISYEAKVAFYLCYANAWVDLIPWLKEHRGLDELSEKFLRFWHYQNQPVELPPGRTCSGLLLPTHVRVPLSADATILLQLEGAASQALHPVFSGQVLALHPLSQFFMEDANLRSIAGKYFGSDEPDRVQRSGRTDDCPRYWDLVGAILEAAFRYRSAHKDREADRLRRSGQLLTPELEPGTAPMVPEAQVFDDWACDQGLKCPNCHSDLRYTDWKPRKAGETITVEYICRNCGCPVNHAITYSAMGSWLKVA